MPYHHGNVREAAMAAALDVIAESGAAAAGLREVARRIGVTHGAAAHHFGDKTGLLTALAAEGFRRLAAALEAAWGEHGDFGRVGVAYVRFAASEPAFFDVMFRPELYRQDDPEVLEARLASGAVLYESAAQVADAAGGDAALAGVAAWAYVHGIATLWRDGNLPPDLADDPVALADRITPLLFQASSAASQRKRRRRRGEL